MPPNFCNIYFEQGYFRLVVRSPSRNAAAPKRKARKQLNDTNDQTETPICGTRMMAAWTMLRQDGRGSRATLTVVTSRPAILNSTRNEKSLLADRQAEPGRAEPSRGGSQWRLISSHKRLYCGGVDQCVNCVQRPCVHRGASLHSALKVNDFFSSFDRFYDASVIEGEYVTKASMGRR